MNDTTNQQGAAGPHNGPYEQPTLPPPHQDLDRLRRSVSDRYIAGVAGGLGRHFNIDPTVIRVLLAVLTLFGGAGVLIYAVCWCFVPEEGKDRAGINVSSDARKILLLAAGGIAVLLAVGDAFNGFDAGWPIASLAVVIAVIMVARDRKADRAAKRGMAAGQPPYYPPPPYAEHPTAEFVGADQPPAWRPPVITPPLVPPHPKRTGIIWFWPTLALIAIGLGIVGMIDVDSKVLAGVYPAVALAITGIMLLVGSMFGRPGGLIFLGVLSTMALSVATVLGTFHFDGRHLQENPTTADAVQGDYSIHMGQIELDLTDVKDPNSLAGKTIKVHLNAGQITVIVPRELNVHIDADMGFAGGIKIPGYDGGGFEDSREKYLAGTPANDLAPLELDLDARVGQIQVERR